MTEEEAKTKWCPMVHFRYREALTGEEQEDEEELKYIQVKKKEASCVASACMMWRSLNAPYYPANVDGYCGLGGKLHYE